MKKLFFSGILLLVIVCMSLAGWFIYVQKAHAAWYNSSWLYRKTITIHHGAGGVTANQTSFPVLVAMTAAQDKTDLHSHARSDGFDILFTSSDSVTKLSSEREKFDSSTGELEAWVNVPSVSGTVDTVIYMYYGNAGSCDQTLASCDGTNNATHVWDTNYKAVMHMAETSGTTSPDSSTAGNTITKVSAIKPNPTTLGEIDGAQSFNGSDDYESIATSNFPTADFTWELWIKPTDDNFRYIFEWETDTYHFLIEPGGVMAVDFGTAKPTSTSTITLNAWNHVVATRTSGTVHYYINGSQDATSFSDSTTLTHTCTAYIGVDAGGCSTPITGANNFPGIMDEVRVSNIARTSTWIATEYNNHVAPYTFYSVGAETTNIPTQVVFSNTALNVTAGTCSALSVQLQSAGGDPANPTGTDTVLLSTNSPGGSFSNASDCSGATSTLSVSYNTSTNSQTIYYKDTRKSPTTWTVTGTQTGGPDTLSTGNQSETITAGSVTRLVVTLPGESFTDGTGNSGTVTSQTAGSSFPIVKISATDSFFNLNTGYSGAKTLVYAGPANAPNSTPPTYTTSVSFTSGQSTTTLTTTLQKAETTTITVTDGGSFGFASSSLVVSPGTLSAGQSTVTVSPSSVPINTNVLVVITAKDSLQNPISGISGSNIVFTGTTATFSTPRSPTTTDASGTTSPYLAWSDVGTKTVVVVVSGTTITQQPTVTVTAAASNTIHLNGGIHINGGSHVQ